MSTLDYKKELKELYQPSEKEVSLVTVPAMNFVTVEGRGDPNTSLEFEQAVGALYAISYGLKMLPKKGVTPDGYLPYSVPPLEGLWWLHDNQPMPTETMDNFSKDDFNWRLMIMQPEFVTKELVAEIQKEAMKKKDNPALANIAFTRFEEGLSVQIMHIGSYAKEKPSLAKLEQYVEQNGYQFRGLHHEIYLGDPRRSAPEKLRTVLRHPVQKI